MVAKSAVFADRMEPVGVEFWAPTVDGAPPFEDLAGPEAEVTAGTVHAEAPPGSRACLSSVVDGGYRGGYRCG